MNNRLNRGFTIVELAIVLVVIGIILGMAVKGKKLVDAARMKAAVAKLNKFEAAVSIYFAKHNGGLPSNEGVSPALGYIPTKIFMDEGLLNAADLKEGITTTPDVVSTGPSEWGLFRCEYKRVGVWGADSVAQTTEKFGLRVCAIPVTPSDVLTLVARPMSARLSCNIEVIKDDENHSIGDGRGWDLHSGAYAARPDTAQDVANYRNCDNYSASEARSYAFKVF